MKIIQLESNCNTVGSFSVKTNDGDFLGRNFRGITAGNHPAPLREWPTIEEATEIANQYANQNPNAKLHIVEWISTPPRNQETDRPIGEVVDGVEIYWGSMEY